MSSHVLPGEVGEIVGVEHQEETTDDGKYCHIVDGSGLTAYCGRKQHGELTCKPYNGEAICLTCGLPTCPDCAVMASLNERLDEMG